MISAECLSRGDPFIIQSSHHFFGDKNGPFAQNDKRRASSDSILTNDRSFRITHPRSITQRRNRQGTPYPTG